MIPAAAAVQAGGGADAGVWRRARPMLGTLVEVGVAGAVARDGVRAARAVTRAFAAVQRLQACLSRFEPDSDVSRFHALAAGQAMAVRPAMRVVLAAARHLHRASDGLFDISLGSAPQGWDLEGDRLTRWDVRCTLDLGGIGKGLAVDAAVQALRMAGVVAGWVNAGGDLRVFGPLELPLMLRDEQGGGVRPFAMLSDGACATSAFDGPHRARLARGGAAVAVPSAPDATWVSVAAPRCLWADALTKLVAASGDAAHPLLARHGARAWQHHAPF